MMKMIVRPLLSLLLLFVLLASELEFIGINVVKYASALVVGRRRRSSPPHVHIYNNSLHLPLPPKSVSKSERNLLAKLNWLKSEVDRQAALIADLLKRTNIQVGPPQQQQQQQQQQPISPSSGGGGSGQAAPPPTGGGGGVPTQNQLQPGPVGSVPAIPASAGPIPAGPTTQSGPTPATLAVQPPPPPPPPPIPPQQQQQQQQQQPISPSGSSGGGSGQPAQQPAQQQAATGGGVSTHNPLQNIPAISASVGPTPAATIGPGQATATQKKSSSGGRGASAGPGSGSRSAAAAGGGGGGKIGECVGKEGCHILLEEPKPVLSVNKESVLEIKPNSNWADSAGKDVIESSLENCLEYVGCLKIASKKEKEKAEYDAILKNIRDNNVDGFLSVGPGISPEADRDKVTEANKAFDDAQKAVDDAQKAVQAAVGEDDKAAAQIHLKTAEDAAQKAEKAADTAKENLELSLKPLHLPNDTKATTLLIWLHLTVDRVTKRDGKTILESMKIQASRDATKYTGFPIRWIHEWTSAKTTADEKIIDDVDRFFKGGNALMDEFKDE